MSTGLGYMPTTFDWSQIAYNGSPLVVPFWAQANVFAGWFCIFAVAAPILYYTNTFYSAYLPLTGSDAYDNTGNIYNSTKILDGSGNFDEAKYRAYSPIFLPITFAIAYGTGFAVLSCVLVHVALYHSKDIWNTLRGGGKKDIHARLVSRYPDAPWWWYGIMTVSSKEPVKLLPLLTESQGHSSRCRNCHSVCLAYAASLVGALPYPCSGGSICYPRWHCLCHGEPEQ